MASASSLQHIKLAFTVLTAFFAFWNVRTGWSELKRFRLAQLSG